MNINPVLIASTAFQSQTVSLYAALFIFLILLLLLMITGWIVNILWQDYQQKLVVIQKQIAQSKLSLKIEYHQLSNLYLENDLQTELDRDFDVLMRETFKSNH